MRKQRLTRRDNASVARVEQAMVQAHTQLPARAPEISIETVVQVIRLERRLRWQERRVAVTVALPRAIVGRRVADGLTAFPVRFGLVAFVGLAVLTDLGLHGAVTMTVCGIVMGAGIGLALMKGATNGNADACVSRGEGREFDGDGSIVEQRLGAGISLPGWDTDRGSGQSWRWQQDRAPLRRAGARRRRARYGRFTRR